MCPIGFELWCEEPNWCGWCCSLDSKATGNTRSMSQLQTDAPKVWKEYWLTVGLWWCVFARLIRKKFNPNEFFDVFTGWIGLPYICCLDFSPLTFAMSFFLCPQITFQFIATFVTLVPLVDCSSVLHERTDLSEVKHLPSLVKYICLLKVLLENRFSESWCLSVRQVEREMCSASAEFEDFVLQFMDRWVKMWPPSGD